jgi:hypothetical protein
MRNQTAFLVVAVGVVAFLLWSRVGDGQEMPPRLAVCLHTPDGTPQDRSRREDALVLARAINAAEGAIAERTRRYAPLSALPGIPEIPPGFAFRFYADDDGYLFSLKDERDPCHYGVFSDEEGRIYEITPSVPQLAT